MTAEDNYSQLNKDALVVVYAVKNFHLYLMVGASIFLQPQTIVILLSEQDYSDAEMKL